MSEDADRMKIHVRLDRLEQRCKWLRREAWLWRIGMLCGVAAAVVLCVLHPEWFGGTPQNARFHNVRATSLSIEDGSNMQRGYFGPDSSGTPALVLNDEGSHLRVGLAVTDEAAGLVVKDTKGGLRARLRVDDKGQPSLELRDSNDQVRALLTDAGFTGAIQINKP